jgi:hypothetical protein
MLIQILFITFRWCLKFLDQKYLLNLFLNCENSYMFPHSFIPAKNIIFYCNADWVSTDLAFSLLHC